MELNCHSLNSWNSFIVLFDHSLDITQTFHAINCLYIEMDIAGPTFRHSKGDFRWQWLDFAKVLDCQSNLSPNAIISKRPDKFIHSCSAPNKNIMVTIQHAIILNNPIKSPTCNRVYTEPDSIYFQSKSQLDHCPSITLCIF